MAARLKINSHWMLGLRMCIEIGTLALFRSYLFAIVLAYSSSHEIPFILRPLGATRITDQGGHLRQENIINTKYARAPAKDKEAEHAQPSKEAPNGCIITQEGIGAV